MLAVVFHIKDLAILLFCKRKRYCSNYLKTNLDTVLNARFFLISLCINNTLFYKVFTSHSGINVTSNLQLHFILLLLPKLPLYESTSSAYGAHYDYHDNMLKS